MEITIVEGEAKVKDVMQSSEGLDNQHPQILKELRKHGFSSTIGSTLRSWSWRAAI